MVSVLLTPTNHPFEKLNSSNLCIVMPCLCKSQAQEYNHRCSVKSDGLTQSAAVTRLQLFPRSPSTVPFRIQLDYCGRNGSFPRHLKKPTDRQRKVTTYKNNHRFHYLAASQVYCVALYSSVLSCELHVLCRVSCIVLFRHFALHYFILLISGL